MGSDGSSSGGLVKLHQDLPPTIWNFLVNDKDVGVKNYEPEIDIYYNRVKVKVVGYHDQIGNPYDLPWAHILGANVAQDMDIMIILTTLKVVRVSLVSG